MNIIEIQNSSAFSLAISGPLSPYSYTYDASFTDSKIILLNINMTSQMKGMKEEILKITFNTTQFLSEKGATLQTQNLDIPLYKISIAPKFLGEAAGGMNGVIGVSIGLIISINLLLGKSGDLLWGIINAIQIIYFFPVLNLYYPDHLTALLSEFSTSILNFPHTN